MDYLYINAIVREVYKDLPCGCPFPAAYSKTMYGTVSGFDCLSNPDIPDVLSFFTVRAKGQPSVMVSSRIQKHTNSASVGRFIQSIGWTWNGDLLFRNLDEMLNTGFYSEQEVNDTALRGGSFSLPKDRRSSYQEIPLSLAPQIKQAILTTVLLRWLRFEAPLRIAVPKQVDYNSYVLSAMKQIYRIFPVSLRARVGFCSYLPGYMNLPETISIGFIPEEMADSLTLSLDGSSPAACNKLNCGTNSTTLDTFIAYIANAPDGELRHFFEEIYEDLEGSGNNDKIVQVTPRDYQNIGSALVLLAMEGSLPELKREWDKRFFENIEKYSPRMQKRIREKIRTTIDPAEFCKLAERRLTADGIEGLKIYREYCIGNPALTDALWNTAVTLWGGQQKTYGELYHAVTRRKSDLDFILDDSKLDALFRLSVQEQLQKLQASSAVTLAEVQKLQDKTRELMTYAGSRAGMDTVLLSVQKFYNQLQDRENAVALDSLAAEFRNLQNTPLPDNVSKIHVRAGELTQFREKAAQLAAVPGAQQLLDEVDRYLSVLHDHSRSILMARFREIESRPAKTVAQIEAAIETVQKLLAQLDKQPQTDNVQSLQQAMRQFISAREADINSSQVKFLQIRQILENHSPDYFQKLEQLDKADKRQLEEQHHQIIDRKLKELRCHTLEQYAAAFRKHYKKPMTLASMAILPAYVFIRVSQDICELKQITVNCPLNCRAAEIADQITGALSIAGRLSGGHSVDVSYNGSRLNSLWFCNLLRLDLDKRTMEDARQTEEIFYSLVHAGAFRGSELTAAVEMLRRCELSIGKLFSAAMEGCFADTTELQYRQAFDLMLRTSRNPAESLKKMAAAEKHLHNKDAKAVRAFRDLQKDGKQKPSGKGMLAVTCILSLLVVVLSVVLILTLLSNKETPDVPSDTSVSGPTGDIAETEPTEPPIVYSREFLFYGQHSGAIALLYGSGSAASFTEHKAPVEALLDMADEETTGMILELYDQYHGTEVAIDEAGTAVKWEAYCFWMLRCYADADTAQLLSILSQTTPDEAVLSILRVIHHGLPAEQEVPEENATEAVEAEIPTTTSESGETEPPATISDVKGAITEAAAGAYEASLAQAARLLLVMDLFGADFTKDFSAHADLVANPALIGNAQNPSYAHFLQHYQLMPGDSVIRFEETGIEVTWDEFVFWECWVLARQGTTAVGAQSFNANLYTQVSEILTVIHQLAGVDAYTPVPGEAAGRSEAYGSEQEIDPVLLRIILSAQDSFEQKQAVYRAIFLQIQGQ